MDNFRYYEIDINRDDLVSCGSLSDLTKRIYEDKEFFSKLKSALEIRGRFNKNALASSLLKFLSVPEYLMNLENTRSGVDSKNLHNKECPDTQSARGVYSENSKRDLPCKPVGKRKKGYIIVIGLQTPTLFDNFHHPLYYYVNLWDLLLSFEVKKTRNTDDFNVFASILWNMTLQGYPDNFDDFQFCAIPSCIGSDLNDDVKDFILSAISRYPSKQNGYVSLNGNSFFDKAYFSYKYDFNIVLTEKVDNTKIITQGDGGGVGVGVGASSSTGYHPGSEVFLQNPDLEVRCHRIFPRGPKKGQRCLNLAIPSKEYQNLARRVYENYFFPTQENIVCDETLFCQECLNNLYVRLNLTEPNQCDNCWNGIRLVEYPKGLKKDDPDFRWFDYCDQYGWIWSCHCLTNELTLHYIIDDYPRALNSREKEMARRFGFSVPTDEEARALILKVEYDDKFISKIIAMQRRYKEKLYSDLNFVRSQIKGAWDKECLI